MGNGKYKKYSMGKYKEVREGKVKKKDGKKLRIFEKLNLRK